MNLYELVGERLALQNKLESLNFDTDTIADTLEGESTAIQEKIENYGFVIRNMEAFSDAIKSEEKRMSERSKAYDNKISRIKDWLKENMKRCDISKIECPAFTIALQKNPASVVIDDESLIPEGYKRLPEPPPLTPNKTMIATAIKSGLEIAGCRLEQSTRLVIK